MTTTSLAQLWAQMDPEHSPYLERAREASSLTIPTLIPQSGAAGEEVLNPYQSLGAEGVRSLSANLTLTILPLDLPFFKLEVPFVAENPEIQSQVETLLARLEKRILLALEEMQVRDKFNQAMQFLVVSGLGVLDFRRDIPRVHRFENIRMRRDGRGNVLCLVVREGVALEDLPEGAVADDLLKGVDNRVGFEMGPVLYTGVKRRQDGGYDSWQEIHVPDKELGQPLDGTEESYDSWLDTPWVVMGFDWLDGEHYPRSYIDQLYSDLETYDLLTRAILESAITAARQVGLVKPGGMTDIDDLLEAASGAYIPGREEDIGSVNNRSRTADLSFAQAQVQTIEARLSRQFLLFLGIRRDAERVTQEEIQHTAQALKQGLGGSYAALATQGQTHLVQVTLRWLRRDPVARQIMEGFESFGVKLKPRIIAGLEVLGRAEALNRQMTSLNVYAQLRGPESLAAVVDDRLLIQDILNGAGSPTPAWLRSQEQIDALQQQAQSSAILEKVGPELVRQAGENTRGVNV